MVFDIYSCLSAMNRDKPLLQKTSPITIIHLLFQGIFQYMLNYSEINVVIVGMNNLISLETELLNQVKIDDESSEYELGERDDDFSNDVKTDDILLKIIENTHTKEKALKNDLFFFAI
jgi:hypothetical protein